MHGHMIVKYLNIICSTCTLFWILQRMPDDGKFTEIYCQGNIKKYIFL
jgi:hypothetical protein